MPGFDDPRYVQQVVTDLQQRLKKLEGASLPFLANQRGAIPGAMRGVQIGDQGMKSAMWLNLIGELAGSAPYQAVTDAVGVTRAEFGNLAARGISAAQFGWRANDANGNPIADAIGLSQVMNSLGFGIDTTPQNFTTTTPTVITGTSVTFTLARASRVLAIMRGIGFTVTNNGQIDLFYDGVQQQTIGVWGIGGPTVTSGWALTQILAAGSHTGDLRGYVTATPGTFTVSGANTDFYFLGNV